MNDENGNSLVFNGGDNNDDSIDVGTGV